MVTYPLRWSKSLTSGMTWNLTSSEVTEKQNSGSVLTASFYGASETSPYLVAPSLLQIPRLQEVHRITILWELMTQTRLRLRLLRGGSLRLHRSRSLNQRSALNWLAWPLHHRRSHGRSKRSLHHRKKLTT